MNNIVKFCLKLKFMVDCCLFYLRPRVYFEGLSYDSYPFETYRGFYSWNSDIHPLTYPMRGMRPRIHVFTQIKENI